MFKLTVPVIFVVVISVLSSLGAAPLYADEFPLDEKLKQCSIAFKASHNAKATRKEATEARKKHIELMVEILQHLNQRNVAAAELNKPLSAKDASDNIRVMGHLMEMLAADHMRPAYDWSWVY